MKTKKEIQLASLTFARAFKTSQASDLDGTFIPFKLTHLYKEHQFYLRTSILFGLLFCYLSYNAWFRDAVYYWHIDGPVILGVSVIVLFFICFIFLISQYIQIGQHLKDALEQPNTSPYGVLITEDYYFEHNPRNFHIIPRDNIVWVDHEEEKDQEIYLELLLDMGTHYEIRGVTYNESDFDFKAWIAKDK
jgi:hypothetical protein